MTDPNAPLREVRRWMRVSTPVNKAASSGLRGRLPQIRRGEWQSSPRP